MLGRLASVILQEMDDLSEVKTEVRSSKRVSSYRGEKVQQLPIKEQITEDKSEKFDCLFSSIAAAAMELDMDNGPSSTDEQEPDTLNIHSMNREPHEGKSFELAEKNHPKHSLIGVESYYGFIETVEDAVLALEVCRRSILPRVKKRLNDRERSLIRAGSVFIFIEREALIRRWTDGKIWSPSRISGEFLVYRELEQRNLTTALSSKTDQSTANSQPIDEYEANNIIENDYNSVNNLDSVNGGLGGIHSKGTIKRDGLLKKTISLNIGNEYIHLICYYSESNPAKKSELMKLSPSKCEFFDRIRADCNLKDPKNIVTSLNSRRSSSNCIGGNVSKLGVRRLSCPELLKSEDSSLFAQDHKKSACETWSNMPSMKGLVPGQLHRKSSMDTVNKTQPAESRHPIVSKSSNFSFNNLSPNDAYRNKSNLGQYPMPSHNPHLFNPFYYRSSQSHGGQKLMHPSYNHFHRNWPLGVSSILPIMAHQSNPKSVPVAPGSAFSGGSYSGEISRHSVGAHPGLNHGSLAISNSQESLHVPSNGAFIRLPAPGSSGYQSKTLPPLAQSIFLRSNRQGPPGDQVSATNKNHSIPVNNLRPPPMVQKTGAIPFNRILLSNGNDVQNSARMENCSSVAVSEVTKSPMSNSKPRNILCKGGENDDASLLLLHFAQAVDSDEDHV